MNRCRSSPSLAQCFGEQAFPDVTFSRSSSRAMIFTSVARRANVGIFSIPSTFRSSSRIFFSPFPSLPPPSLPLLLSSSIPSSIPYIPYTNSPPPPPILLLVGNPGGGGGSVV